MGDSLHQTSAAGTDAVEEVEQFDAIIIGAGVTGLYQLVPFASAWALGSDLRGWWWRGRYLVLVPRHFFYSYEWTHRRSCYHFQHHKPPVKLVKFG